MTCYWPLQVGAQEQAFASQAGSAAQAAHESAAQAVQALVAGLHTQARELSGLAAQQRQAAEQATQAVGKIPVDVKQLGADMLAFSSHKLYGPKGAGALYISRDGKPDLAPVLHGGAHEKGLRPGTLNVPGIVGFGKACELCAAERQAEAKRLGKLRDRLESELSELEGILFNGAKGNRLPHTTSISFGDIDGSNLLRQLKGLALSQGSACSSARRCWISGWSRVTGSGSA